MGSDSQSIIYSNLANLGDLPGGNMNCLVFPASTSDVEEKALLRWVRRGDNLLTNEILILFSFLLFMGIFAGVGIASMWVKQDTTDDYLVAGRGMHPALAALSAVSTWNSGYMFIGLLGSSFCKVIQQYGLLWCRPSAN